MYIYAYIYKYTYTYICICIYICTYIYTYVYNSFLLLVGGRGLRIREMKWIGAQQDQTWKRIAHICSAFAQCTSYISYSVRHISHTVYVIYLIQCTSYISYSVRHICSAFAHPSCKHDTRQKWDQEFVTQRQVLFIQRHLCEKANVLACVTVHTSCVRCV